MQGPMKLVVILIGIIGAGVAIVVLANPPAPNDTDASSNPTPVSESIASTIQNQDARSQAQSGPGQATSQPGNRTEENPAAEWFNAKESDPRAIELADLTMQKMGGRAAWDDVRYVTWNFTPSKRRFIWDRVRNVVRIEHQTKDPEDSTKPASGVMVFDLLRLTAEYWINGEQVHEEGKLAAMGQLGLRLWSNDAYWLFMPYKLKDSHTTLLHLGEREMTNNRGPAEVLELTFRGIGITPQNRYHVYISKKTGLVEQWDFFPDHDAAAPRFQLQWGEWRRHGPILLSDYREQLAIRDIAVFDDLPDWVWTEGNFLDMSQLREFVAEPKDPTDPKYLPGPISSE